MYRPLPNCLTIASSSIDGLGLHATEKILSGTVLGITHVYSPGYENDYIRTPLGGFINHSNSPNCVLIDNKFVKKLKTLKEVTEGSELTVQYGLYSVK